jgi:hypothetical protein
MTDAHERKRTLLTFLFAKSEDQSNLFKDIIIKELNKMKEFYSIASKDTELFDYTKQLNKEIYNSKIKAIEIQTRVLKEQMLAQKNGTKHPSLISIIDRKLYIVELQIDVGVYNIIQNNNVKFYFDA